MMGQESFFPPVRWLHTSKSFLGNALQPAARWLDACWWYLGGNGASMPRDFARQVPCEGWSREQLYQYWQQLWAEYVDEDTPVGRVGIPGFFSRLGDSVDFQWSCFFAIEGATMPLATLQTVAQLGNPVLGPLKDLPPDVLLVARDVDSAYQEYGFRDEWMFKAVLAHLRNTGHDVEERVDL